MKRYVAMMIFAFVLAATAGVLDGLKDKATNTISETSSLLPNLTALTERLSRLEEALEQTPSGRTALHGNILQQYILTNAVTKRVQRVDLYADGWATTNGATAIRLTAPETLAKARAEAKAKAEEVKRLWEKANLPAELAKLREEQRQAKNAEQ